MGDVVDRLEGMHALVTGAGRGIGAAIVEALTAAGARVTAHGRSPTGPQALVKAGKAAGFVLADVTNPEAMARAVAEAEAAQGPIDILVSNAGGVITAPFKRTNAEDFRALFELNLIGVVNGVSAVLPGMTERGFGRIINVASIAGLKGFAYASAYAVSKHAVVGLTRSLALETAMSGVTVNAVCPGYVATDMVADGLDRIVETTGRDRTAAEQQLVQNNPQKRLIQPAEVAAAVTFLAGRDCGAINGAVLPISGGEI
jgi:3-hydroxybutyrate dehydrogenase